MGKGHADLGRKVVPVSFLLRLRHQWRRQHRVVVFCQGCFDLLHIGHIHLLSGARQYGDILVVAVNGDESVRRLKGRPRPIVSAEDRATIVAAIEYVDYVTILSSTDARGLLARLRPDVYIDDSVRAHRTLEAKIVSQYRGQLAIVQQLAGHSTTSLIEAIIKAYG